MNSGFGFFYIYILEFKHSPSDYSFTTSFLGPQNIYMRDMVRKYLI